jgi:hypothetical protein
MERALVPAQDTGISFGSSHLDAEDFIPPRVKVVQAMSDERTQGVEEGSFYNTLTSEDYGPLLNFIPISTFKNRVLLVRSEKRVAINAMLKKAGLKQVGAEVDGLSCRSLDMVTGRGVPGDECGACPLSEWMGEDSNTPPFCSETYNVTAVTEMGDLIILGFSKSSAKVGKRLFSMMRLSSGAPWRFMYEATSIEQKGTQGRYMVPVIKKVGAPPPELMKVAAEFASQLAGVVIDVSPTEDEAPVPADGDAPWETAEA